MSEQLTSFKQRERTAEQFRALGHPVRLAIIELLGQSGPHSVTDIYTAVGVEQAAASHQLRILRNAGLVRVSRDGKLSMYELTDARWSEVLQLGFLLEE